MSGANFDPWVSRLPSGFTREDRIRLLAEAADSLMAARLPSPAARLYLAGAVSAWLREGGRIGALERDFLRVAAPARSTLTPARVLARISSDARATDDIDAGMIDPSTTLDSQCAPCQQRAEQRSDT